MSFDTGLFLLRTPWLVDGTAAWAQCAVDLMDQPIVRFHYVSADGFGKDSYGWYDNLWLRVDWPSGTLQFVMEVDGEWSVESTFDLNDGLHDQLVDLRCGDADDGDAERLLPVLLESAAGNLAVSALDEGTVVRLDAETFMHLHSVAAERERRGLWEWPVDPDVIAPRDSG